MLLCLADVTPNMNTLLIAQQLDFFTILSGGASQQIKWVHITFNTSNNLRLRDFYCRTCLLYGSCKKIWAICSKYPASVLYTDELHFTCERAFNGAFMITAMHGLWKTTIVHHQVLINSVYQLMFGPTFLVTTLLNYTFWSVLWIVRHYWLSFSCPNFLTLHMFLRHWATSCDMAPANDPAKKSANDTSMTGL